MPLLDRLRIVLVQPESPGNIGAVARAIKTMGLSQLFLVAPLCDPHCADAVNRAHNAEDVLERASVVKRLEDALADTTFSVATTQRTRRQKAPFFTPEEIAERVFQHADDEHVAIVFGRESCGLMNDEVALCSVVSTIPAATEVPALNLSHAVMVYVYALHQASLREQPSGFEWRVASHQELEGFYEHLTRTLHGQGTQPASTFENYVARFRRVVGRIPLESRDVRLLHMLLSMADRGARRTGGEDIYDPECEP